MLFVVGPLVSLIYSPSYSHFYEFKFDREVRYEFAQV